MEHHHHVQVLIDLPGQVERGDQRGQQAREEIRRLVVVVTSTAGAAGHKADHLKLDDLAVPGAPSRRKGGRHQSTGALVRQRIDRLEMLTALGLQLIRPQCCRTDKCTRPCQSQNHKGHLPRAFTSSDLRQSGHSSPPRSPRQGSSKDPGARFNKDMTIICGDFMTRFGTMGASLPK